MIILHINKDIQSNLDNESAAARIVLESRNINKESLQAAPFY